MQNLVGITFPGIDTPPFAPVEDLYCDAGTTCEVRGLLNAAAGIALDIAQVDPYFLPFCLPQALENYATAPDGFLGECPDSAPTAITTFFKFERTPENYHGIAASFPIEYGQSWCYDTQQPCSRESLNDFYNRTSAYEWELTRNITYHTIIGPQCAYDSLYLVRDPEAFCSESPPNCTDIGLVDVTFTGEDTVTLAYCRDGCITGNPFTDLTNDDILEVLEGHIVSFSNVSQQDPFCLSTHPEFIENPVVALSETSFDKDSYCASDKAALRFQVGKCGGDALDDFVFHSYMDSNGGDIGGARIESGEVSDFAAVCRKHPDCKGFNSNGWVKKTIRPSNEWSVSFENRYSGLYLKKQCFDYDRIDDWPCSVRAGLGMCQFAPPR